MIVTLVMLWPNDHLINNIFTLNFCANIFYTKHISSIVINCYSSAFLEVKISTELSLINQT